MVDVPESVQEIVEKCSAKYPSDIEKAVDESERRIVRLPDYKSLVKMLVRKAIQEMVYDARHITNVGVKRETGRYGGPAKVSVGGSSSVLAIGESVYSYHIAGTVLGSLLGKELVSISESERAIGNGHLINSELCGYLACLVPSDKTVRESVSETKLRNLFRKAQRRVGGSEAAC